LGIPKALPELKPCLLRRRPMKINEKSFSNVKEYRQKERDEIRLRRMGNQFGNFYVSGEAKLAFVIRIDFIIIFSDGKFCSGQSHFTKCSFKRGMETSHIT
jgi:hypothetical protein